MKDFVIITDTGCDISPALLAEWKICSLDLTFRFTDEDKDYANSDLPTKDFYQRMRDGGIAKTSAINTEAFAKAFEEYVKEGKEVLYLCFSSGLSSTCSSAVIASRQLKETYPDAKVTVVDTLAASAGQGMIVYLAAKKRDEGCSMEEIAKYVEEIRLNVCHWFTVDDLVYLKRGGRVSAAAAFFGGVLGIKPVLHVDNEGHLVAVSKVRGRKTALNALATKMAETISDATPVFISHADCEADVEELKILIKNKTGKDVDLVTDIGAVIGSHSGPGTLALFFLGKER